MEESRELNAVIDVDYVSWNHSSQKVAQRFIVEDTMIRIAHSQGIVDCNVLAMPAAIFFSIENTNISRMKRVTSSSYNIEKVCDVNQISRQLVGGKLDLETAFKLTALQAQPLPYTKLQVTLAATFSAPFFSIMFSGNIYDALGAGVATLFGFAFSLYVEKFIRIPFVTAFAGAFVFGMIAQFWARYTGFPSTADLIIAGAVMPLYQGLP